VAKAATPDNRNITYRETFYSIIETLINKFVGLSPIELLNAPTSVVLELWTDTIINSRKDRKNTHTSADASADAEMVYSYNATWC
jgi:hypothetical protein